VTSLTRTWPSRPAISAPARAAGARPGSLAPLGDVVAHQLAELFGRGRRDDAALRAEKIGHALGAQHGDQLAADLLHQRGRQVARREQADPAHRLEAGVAQLDERRRVGEQRRAAGRRHGERAQPAVPDVRVRIDDVVEQDAHLAA